MRRRWSVKDVRWRDFFLALVLTPILLLPVILVVYLVLYVLFGLSSGDAWGWANLIIIPTSLVEAFILARRYRGEDDPIEHGWAWLAVSAAVAGACFVTYAAGVASAEVALYFAYAIYTEIATVFLLVMLTVYISALSQAPRSSKTSKVDVERETMVMMMRR